MVVLEAFNIFTGEHDVLATFDSQKKARSFVNNAKTGVKNAPFVGNKLLGHLGSENFVRIRDLVSKKTPHNP